MSFVKFREVALGIRLCEVELDDLNLWIQCWFSWRGKCRPERGGDVLPISWLWDGELYGVAWNMCRIGVHFKSKRILFVDCIDKPIKRALILFKAWVGQKFKERDVGLSLLRTSALGFKDMENFRKRLESYREWMGF